MLTDHFYHYTSLNAARDIFENETRGGLRPIRRFIYMGHGNALPDKAHSGAVFGMLKERPREFTETFWGSNISSLFNEVIEKAKAHLEPTILLKARITSDDDVCVADWGVHFDPDFHGTDERVTPRHITDRVKDAYWRSVVPLSEYEEGSYRVPEVICFNVIPADRLEVCKAIPGSELPRYIETGEYDPAALERDKQARVERGQHMAAFLKARL